MKILAATLALLAFAGNVCAVEAPPVLLIFHKDVGVKTAGNGLLMLGISAWANHSVNKASAVKVARFHDALGGFDLTAEASHVFGCAGSAPDCGRVAFTDPAQFEAALAAREDKAGIVVEITPELIADEMLMRGVSKAVVLSDKKGGKGKDKGPQLEDGTGNIAVFNTRPPSEIAALKKKNPAELEQYWLKGEPRRIVSDARHGLVELNNLFVMLEKEGRTDGKMPEAWKQLPKVKDFKESGRISCGGVGVCPGIHVLKDNGDSFVLVCCGNAAGWFDAAAAAHNTNFIMMAMLGILGR
jgi:hypothetical protein